MLNRVVVHFVMSYRVAVLTVEWFILGKLFQTTAADELVLRFIDTEKNAPFRHFIKPLRPIDHGVLVSARELPDLWYLRYKGAVLTA